MVSPNHQFAILGLAAPTNQAIMPFTELLLVLAAVMVGAVLLGALAQRIGQPAVLGELIAGVILGPSLLGILDPHDGVMHAISELGVLVLLFQIGLHTNLRSILGVGAPAMTVGIAGVIMPAVGGYFAAQALGIQGIAAIVCAAALTATSIGISARVLSDLGTLETKEGQIVLGAAVLDDIVGLIILSIVAGIAGGAAVSMSAITQTTAIALGFLLVAIAVGSRTVPALFHRVERLPGSGALGALGLAFALALAAIADKAGSAMIIGAFAAGLVLHNTPQRKRVEKATTSLGYFFVPIFFAVVGAAVDLRALADTHVLLIGGTLTLVGAAGKYLSGFAPFWIKAQKPMIGAAMIPRGEVGLIFAQLGRTTGVLDAGLYSALLLMVMVTTFMAPPLLAYLSNRAGHHRPPKGPTDESGIDDLVSGERRPNG